MSGWGGITGVDYYLDDGKTITKNVTCRLLTYFAAWEFYYFLRQWYPYLDEKHLFWEGQTDCQDHRCVLIPDHIIRIDWSKDVKSLHDEITTFIRTHDDFKDRYHEKNGGKERIVGVCKTILQIRMFYDRVVDNHDGVIIRFQGH